MTLVGFLIYLLIVAIVGALGQAIAGYSLGGCLVSMVVASLVRLSANGSPKPSEYRCCSR